MKMNLKHPGIALSCNGPEWSISYSKLSLEIDRAIQDIDRNLGPNKSNSLLTITMSRTVRPIVYLLAALISKRPIAVFSSDWTSSETKTRLHLLGPSISLDTTDWPASANQSKDNGRLRPETALILFTSGTAGLPKAVELSRSNIESNTSAVIESLNFNSVREQHLFLDLSYSFGLLGQLVPALEAGVATHLYSKVLNLRGDLTMKKLNGMISGVPNQLRVVAEIAPGPQAGITQIVSAGAHLSIQLRETLHRQFPAARITSNYGQTEASPRILSIGSEEEDFWSGVTGRPVAGIQLRISSSGELEVRGPQIMLGYLADQEATDDKLRDGYLRTGDIAIINSKGSVTIEGRNDDQIKIAGERIGPAEIESVICELLQISECLVFPNFEKLPDGSSSSEPVLALALLDSNLLPAPEDLRKILASKLSKKKVPHDIYLAPSFPKSVNGKTRRLGLDVSSLGWKQI